jgi:hypothetical protein
MNAHSSWTTSARDGGYGPRVSAPEVDVILFNDQDLRHPSRRTRGIL